ncbi:MAG TPA: zinc dependent phospholipase C family protein [Terriglobales bacterium]|nr:zinc dependent phospholipase C family protein [Terriglobales bacterium]
MRALRLITLLACVAGCSLPSHSYSVLTHEQIIDLAWEDQIRPLLLARFPQASPDDLKHAHAFAYGGSVVQDMGYYPFGKKYFSDLVHYVRTGDFVAALIEDSSDINEYAFALGALAHYSSDNMGHPTINQVVAIEFPKLRAKYGSKVTYADDHKSHIRTEFGFDMVQVAKNRYTSDRFHDFIGFEIAKPLLERAFKETYDMQLSDVLGGNEDLAIGTFRRAVSTIVPAMTRVALLNKNADLVPERQNRAQKQFLYELSRTSYEKEWGKGYRRPGFGSRVLAFILRIFPKVGPASALDFKIPTTQTEDMYIKSVNKTMDDYKSLLEQARGAQLKFVDTDCDTGRETRAAEYPLADDTYSRLLLDLARHNFTNMTPEIRNNMLSYYSDPHAAYHDRRNKKRWAEMQQALQQLRSSQGSSVANATAP